MQLPIHEAQRIDSCGMGTLCLSPKGFLEGREHTLFNRPLDPHRERMQPFIYRAPQMQSRTGDAGGDQGSKHRSPGRIQRSGDGGKYEAAQPPGLD